MASAKPRNPSNRPNKESKNPTGQAIYGVGDGNRTRTVSLGSSVLLLRNILIEVLLCKDFGVSGALLSAFSVEKLVENLGCMKSVEGSEGYCSEMRRGTLSSSWDDQARGCPSSRRATSALIATSGAIAL